MEKNIKLLNKDILSKSIAKYRKAINLEDKIIAIELEDNEEFISCVLAAFLNKCKVLALDITDSLLRNQAIIDNNNIDLLITDRNKDEIIFKNIIYNKDIKEDTFCYEENLSVSDIIISDIVNTKLISKEKILNWIEFNKNILKFDGNKAVFVYENNKDLYSYIWLLPIINKKELYLSNSTNIDFNDFETVIMPLRLTDKLLSNKNIKNLKLITYGEELISYSERKEIMNDLNINWVNYYGFPYVTYISAVKNFVINGKEGMYHQIKPIKNITLSIVNQMKQKQPKRTVGNILENNKEFVNYKGIMIESKVLISLGQNDVSFVKEGYYYNKNELEYVLKNIESINDFYIDKNKIYYSLNDYVSIYRIKKEIYKYIPDDKCEFDFIEVPNFKRDENGNIDSLFLERYTLGSKEIKSISKKIRDKNINNSLIVSFKNAEGEITLENTNNNENNIERKTIKNKKAIANGRIIKKEEYKYKNLIELMEEREKSNQEILFIEEESETKLTYKQLFSEAKKIAKGLKESGVNNGDKVIFQIPDNKDFLEAYWACMILGAIPAPIAVLDDYGVKNLNTDKLNNIWNMLGKAVILTSTEIEKSLKKMEDNVLNGERLNLLNIDNIKSSEEIKEYYNWNLDEMSLILFTSGSTGVPKGVILNQKNIFGRTLGEIKLYNLKENEVSLNWMSLTHAAGLIWCHIRDLYLNILDIHVNSQVILKKPLKWLEFMNKYKVSLTWAPNFAFALVNNFIDNEKDYGWDLSNLKYAYSGGEANVSRTLRRCIKNLKKYNLPDNAIKPTFGMTETSSCITYNNTFTLENSTDDDKFIPVGIPMPGIEIKILDENNNILNEGEVGSIVLKGDTVTKGYYNNEEANKESFTNDGYLITGDLGYIEDNTLTITGRAKDIIIINGLNYYVQDIESVVDEIEEVNASYTVATSVKNNDGNEEVLVFFAPNDEKLLEDNNIEALKELVKKIRTEVFNKSSVNPKYIIPTLAEKSVRTEIGKKQRSKYRDNFKKGAYNEIISKLENGKNNEKYLLKEVFEINPLINEKYNKEKVYVISDNKERAENILKNTTFNYEITNFDYVINNEIKYLIDFNFYNNEIKDVDNDSLINLSYKLLEEAKKLEKIKGRNIKIVIPTKQSITLEEDCENNSENGIIRGFIKTFNLENTNIRCKEVDFDNFNINLLFKEVVSKNNIEIVCYRNGKRYVSKLKSYKDTLIKNSKVIKNNDFIVIAGGLGGVGRKLSEYLLKKYNVNLLILGASPLNEEKNNLIEKMQKINNNVSYEQVDITNYNEIEELVSKYEDKYKRKLGVIFNLAGKVSADKSKKKHFDDITLHNIENETHYSFEEVLKSKALSTITLQKLREKRKEASLILFSSNNAYFGGISLASYSAANSFQDEYCKALKRKYENTYCISWSMWSDIGINNEMPEAIKKMSINNGFKSISFEENIFYLEYILNKNINNSIVGIDRNVKKNIPIIDDDYNEVLEVYYSDGNLQEIKKVIEEENLDNIYVTYKKVNSILLLSDNGEDIDINSLISNKNILDVAFNKDELSEEHIKMINIWKEILGVSNIDVNGDFFEYGGNSISISRMIFKINEVFKVEISFKDILTCSTINKLVKRINKIKHSEEEILINDEKMLIDDINLKYPIKDYIKNLTYCDNKKNALITGSTGFLGVYILYSLIKNTDYTVYAISRADSNEKAKERIINNLKKYDLLNDIDLERIVFLKGDVSQVNLGLSEKEYNILSEKIDVIYHAAAEVNFIYRYDVIAPSNVEGTRKIIKFAATKKIKEINYISSYAVYETIPGEINERTPINITPAGNGYIKTKWVADNIMQLAVKEGIPCRIHRIGTVAGDTRNGMCQNKDFFWLLVNDVMKIKKIPAVGMSFKLMPVDTLAKMIVEISKTKYDKENNIYHLVYEDTTIPDMIHWIEKFNMKLEVIRYEDWVDEIIKYGQENQDEALIATLGIFPKSIDANVERVAKKEDIIVKEFAGFKYKDIKQNVSSKATYKLLDSINFNEKKADYELFLKTYDYFKKEDFFK